MNTFYEHHHDSIRFAYRCFDRILLNGLIQPFQQPERVVGFFNTYRELYPVSKAVLRRIAAQYEHWLTARAAQWHVPIVDAPDAIDRLLDLRMPENSGRLLRNGDLYANSVGDCEPDGLSRVHSNRDHGHYEGK